jgi:amidophosphoribosyltransferase
MKELVKKLYVAGAKKVHVRVASPPIENPCPFGVALNDYEELLAHNHPDMEERRVYLGVDSVSYLSMNSLVEASGLPKERQCTFCFDGKGPKIDISGVIFLDERKE